MAIATVPRGFTEGWHEVGEPIGFLLLILAALGRIWSMAYIVGRKNRELCQQGPYSLMRNPLYFFSFLGVIGFALGLQQILLGGIAGMIFLGYYAAVIRGEERILESLHGDRFRDYCRRVPRFWPRWGLPARGDESLVVHLGPFLKGLREVFWFLAAIILVEAVEWAHVQTLWPAWTMPF